MSTRGDNHAPSTSTNGLVNNGEAKTPEASSDTIISSGSVVILLTDEEGKLIHVEPATLQMFDCDPNADDLSVFDLLADVQDQYTILAELHAKGFLRDFQTSIKHRNGLTIPMLSDIHTVELEGTKRLIFLLQSIGDIHEKQLLTESRYQRIFNNVPVGIAITDQKGNFYAFNPSVSELVGYSAAELREIQVQQLYQSVEDRDALLSNLSKARTVRNFETNLISKDGEAMTVLLNCDIIHFGYIEGAILTSLRDITPLKRIEAALIQERNFTDAILNISDSLIMVCDLDGHVIKFNHTCEKVTGYTFEEFGDKPFWSFLSLHPQDTLARSKQAMETRHVDPFESYWKTKNGDLRLISWSIAVLIDENGKDCIVCTGSDITERKKADEALLEMNRELEQSILDLEDKTQAISLLADMSGFLQGCRDVAEACTICAQYIQSICPESSGAIYRINNSANLAETQEAWGDPTISQKLFDPTQCWAVRRGRLNLIDQSHHGLLCSHLRKVDNTQYICIPMMANGETIGILHISYTCIPSEAAIPAECSHFLDSKVRLLTAAAEACALSLSNIILQTTLRQQSIRDALTGIYNRRYMEETLYRELVRAQREQTTVAVLMLDIDHFKEFNDSYGHDGGDALLRNLGAYFRQDTRGEDIVSRYGGEEFLIVLPGMPHSIAMAKADEIRLGVSSLKVMHLGSVLRPCTISIGIASYPKDGETADEIIKAADNALYRAKAEGRNRVVSA